MNEAEVLRELDKMWTQLQNMDTHGTRGVSVVQSQLADLLKDVSALESRMQAHDRVHVQEARDRASNRRWTVTTAIAFAVLLVAILALLLGQYRG